MEVFKINNLFQKLGEEAFGKNNKPLPELNQPPESFDVQLRITDVLFGAELPESRNPSTPDMWLISRDMVKELVMKHGAVAIAYHEHALRGRSMDREKFLGHRMGRH